MEIVPNLCANGPNDFEKKTRAVDKGTATIVVAIVAQLDQYYVQTYPG
jgi:hypothetical protein